MRAAGRGARRIARPCLCGRSRSPRGGRGDAGRRRRAGALSIERLVVDEPASEPIDDPWLGQSLGPWRLTRVIGRGGMGLVYGAVRADGQYQLEVAVKLMRAGPRDPVCRRALPHRAAGAGVPQAPQHRRAPGRRLRSRRHALPRDGARRWDSHHRVVPQSVAVFGGTPESLSRRLRRRSARAPGPRGAPRSQAVEHPRVVGRRREAAGLRDCQAPRSPGVGDRGFRRRSPRCGR